MTLKLTEFIRGFTILCCVLIPAATKTRAQECGTPPDPWSTWAQYQAVCAKYGGHIEDRRCVGWNTNWCHRNDAPTQPTADDRATEDARAEAEKRAAEARKREEAAETKRREEAVSREKFKREQREALESLKGVSSGDLKLKDADDKLELKDPEKERLMARERELSAAIDRDLKAIRDMGFDRRAEDFAEWEKLAADAQSEYEAEIKGIIIDVIVDKSRASLLEGFKRFDAAKGARWIAFLESQDPKPVELIAAIRRVSRLRSKGRAAYDAKHVVMLVDKLNQSIEVKDIKTALPALLDLVCDAFPKQPINKQCEVFRAESKWAIAALYNYAARHFAISEVERLTQMTEAQLIRLREMVGQDGIFKKHVRERNEVRARLKELGMTVGAK